MAEVFNEAISFFFGWGGGGGDPDARIALTLKNKAQRGRTDLCHCTVQTMISKT